MSRTRIAVLAILASSLAQPARAQLADGDPLTNDGIRRASAVVDSVFVDRLVPSGYVGGGDWGSYLMARLGVIPIPDDLQLRVLVDTARITMHGTIADLPVETRRVLGPLLGMFPLQTHIAADIQLTKVAREVVRFRLAVVRVNGMQLPEALVASVLAEVGRQYPVLSRSGRDLFVQVPQDAEVELLDGGVRLLGPGAVATTPGR